LGGLLVIGRDSSILFGHKESVFGDHADLDAVAKAIQSMNAK
jgi:hypothetical protein